MLVHLKMKTQNKVCLSQKTDLTDVTLVSEDTYDPDEDDHELCYFVIKGI